MIKRALAYTLTALGLASTYATLAKAEPKQPSTQKKLEIAPQYNLRTAERTGAAAWSGKPMASLVSCGSSQECSGTVALYARYSPDSQSQSFDRGPIPDLPRTRQAKAEWLLLLTRIRASRA